MKTISSLVSSLGKVTLLSAFACSGPPTGVPPGPGPGPTPGPNPGEQCYDLTAHGVSSPTDTSPRMIPSGESYYCFYYQAPWPTGSVATAFRSKLDNPNVLHHWFLYSTPTARPNGTAEACLPLHPDGPETVAGWAPGGKDVVLPSDVAAELPAANSTLMVEWHSFNSGAALVDRSSVRVCTTPAETRPKVASIAWLGTELLAIPPYSTASFSGTCRPGRSGMNATDPIHILSVTPHMHKLGTHFKTEILRPGASPNAIYDHPFSATNQTWAETIADVAPGDTLRTTCTFNNTTAANVGWGSPFTPFGEMCYGFVMHYPAHSLDNGTRSLLGARNSCL